MTRFFCFPLLFVLALPVFAQEEPPVSRTSLPRDPALQMRVREQIARDLQNTQRMLTYVNPTVDPQLFENLTTQQTELSKQLREISEQMQAGTQSPQLPGMSIREQELLSPTGRAGISPMMPQPRGSGWEDPYMQSPVPAATSPNRSEMPVPPSYNQIPPMPTMYNPPMYGGPTWADQDRAWETTPWGPRLPKELTDMKQSIEALRKEIGELKETIKALETQIQLLSRNILLNEKIKENGN